ncbi:hypothetical protein JB92DRAFT_2834337 [Gautieria morchelliformis]|nr:hypothetical protein JB92DRAFT_2834337 [Gautieria morchelliformis]
MATCSGKAYSERPALAETDTPNPYTESPQEPGHEETSMDLGDDIEITTSQVSDDEYHDRERAEGVALDVSQSTETRIPLLEVEDRTPIGELITENRHGVMTCRPCPADGADWRERRPRSADGADSMEYRPCSADGADLIDLHHRSVSEAEVDNEYVDTESSQDEFLPAQRDMGKGRPPNGHAIVRTNARYFQDWFSDHSPGLPTTPPTASAHDVAPHRRLWNGQVMNRQHGPTTTGRKIHTARSLLHGHYARLVNPDEYADHPRQRSNMTRTLTDSS